MKAIKNYKIILFTFIMFNSSFVFSQNWDLIKPERKSIYMLPDSNIMVLEVESVINTKMNIKRNSGLLSYLPETKYEDCWFGHSYIKVNNGLDIIFANRNNQYTNVASLTGITDQILFNKKTFLGDSWQLVNSTNSGLFMASVTGLGVETFLGITDSVRTILVTSSVNSFSGTLKLSKNYGFLQAFSLNCFPNNIQTLTLIGIQSVAGFQDFGAKEIYNFEVGNEFMYDIYEQQGIERNQIYTFEKILSKSETAENYNYSVFQEKYSGCVEGNICAKLVTITSDVVYNKNLSFPLSIPNSIKCFLNSNTYPFQNEYEFKKKKVKEYRYNIIDYDETKRYQIGLGMTYFNGSGRVTYDYKKLIYYKKENSQMGVKLDFVLTSISNPSVSNPTFNITPNPSFGECTINNLSSVAYEIEVFNTSGSLVYKESHPNGNSKINLHQSGVFIVKIFAENQVFIHKIINYESD